MNMREVQFVDSLDEAAVKEHYRTFEDFDCILNAFSFPAPEIKTQTVDLPGADGTIDLSTALTDGEPRFDDRSGTITLIATGRHWKRQLDKITNALHGRKFYFCVPDDTWWFYGRIAVSDYTSNGNVGTITLTCTCEPWKYAKHENITTFEVSTTPLTKRISNHGRRKAVPVMYVSEGVNVAITDGTVTQSGYSGGSAYILAEYPVSSSGIKLTITGDAQGVVRIVFREAVL
ncbi:MAG: hypothetical protein ACI4EA_03685 [Candidatus Ornithomonoglobus sp.]